ncbi:MAG: hypothetical protein IPJ41_00750 [Phycisphaerales bacterium]|nr:hypothetical protein [Phycisphaerales bacterium]
MQNRRKWLIAANLGLAGAAAVVWTASPALGLQPTARARGQYTMVAGEMRSGPNSSAIYIFDSVNQEMVAVRWNESRTELDGLDYRNLDADQTKAPGR